MQVWSCVRYSDKSGSSQCSFRIGTCLWIPCYRPSCLKACHHKSRVCTSTYATDSIAWPLSKPLPQQPAKGTGQTAKTSPSPSDHFQQRQLWSSLSRSRSPCRTRLSCLSKCKQSREFGHYCENQPLAKAIQASKNVLWHSGLLCNRPCNLSKSFRIPTDIAQLSCWPVLN